MRKTKHLVAFLVAVVMVLTFACGLLAACNKKYTITFDANGGKYGTANTVEAETEKNGVVATEPARPTREGYTFNGYNTSKDGKGDAVKFGVDGYKFKEDTTVYAQWKVKGEEPPIDGDNYFTITLNANGGQFASGNTTTTLQTNENGMLESLSVPTREGFIYQGYNEMADVSGYDVDLEYVFSESTTIYAQWKTAGKDDIPDEPIGESEITLVVGEGTLPEEAPTTVMTDEFGRLSEEDLPTPTPNDSNAIFVGWYSDEEGLKKAVDTTFYEDSSIYAIYASEYEITLVVGEGTLPEGAPTKLVTVNGKLTREDLLAAVPVCNTAHMSFVGWSTTQSGSNMVTLDTVFERNTTIYAIYVRDDGVWSGTTGTAFLAEFPRNTGNTSEVEYWLGEGKTLELTSGSQVCFYINGKLCTSIWITGTGVRTEVDPKPSYVTVTKTAAFMIFMKDYSGGAGTDYVVEFRAPTDADVGGESDIPEGAAPIVVKIGKFEPITIYLATSAGKGVTSAQLSSYSIYTFEPEIFGNWNQATTDGKCASMITVSGDVIPHGWIIRWSGTSMQTGNIEGAIKEGGTYVIKLPAANKGDAQVTEIVTGA